MKNFFCLIFLFLLFSFAGVAQSITDWEHTNGPNGGGISVMCANEDYAFVSGRTRLYRTSDGLNWEALQVQGGFGTYAYGNTIIHVTDGKDTEGFIEPKRFLVSFDNGDNWVENNMPPTGTEFHAHSTFFASHGIYHADPQGQVLHHSTDQGLTWTTLNTPVENLYFNLWMFEDVLYGRKGPSILKFNHTDNSWEEILVPVGLGESIGGIVVKGANILAKSDINLWYSHDDGETWENTSFDTGNSSGGFVSSENNSSIYYTSSEGSIFNIIDFGNDIQSVYANEEIRFFDISTILFKNGIITYTAYAGLVRWDENSQILTDAYQGLHSARVWDLVENDEKIWAACGSGLFSYDPVLKVWSDTSSIPRTFEFGHRIYTNRSGLLVSHASSERSIYVSADNGVSWDSIRPSTDPDQIIGINIIDNNIFVDIRFGPNYISRDTGATWQILDFPASSRVVKFDDQYLTYDDNIIFASEDEGNSWFEFADVSEVADSGAEINDLLLVGDRLFGIFGWWDSTRIYSSLDGQEWTFSHGELPAIDFWYDPPVEDRMRDFGIFSHEGIYYLYSGETGLFVSTDSAATWTFVIPPTSKRMVEKDGTLFMGGGGGGVIRFEAPKNFGSLISGTVYLDDNNNGIFDIEESGIPNVNMNLTRVNSNVSNYFTRTKMNGGYNLGVNNISMDTIRPRINFDYIDSVNPPFYLADTISDDRNFGICLTPDITDMSVRIHSGNMRPGFDTRLYLSARNRGTIASDGKISLKLDQAVTFLNAEPTPTENFGDSLVWNYLDLDIFQSQRISVDINVDQTVELGSQICSNIKVFPTETDIELSNNSYAIKTTVVGSYDPNDKRVEPAEGLTPDEIAAGKELIYTIRFQNTGTFFAEKVRITDQLDTALYYPSFRLIAASHEITNLELRPNGLLEIEFDQIFLPDSTNNELESHGFISFAIQRNKQYRASKSVDNTASIYFDFNDPIFTNTVSFTVPDIIVSTTDFASTKEINFRVYPNPTSNQFFVDARNLIDDKVTLRIQTVSGITLHEQTNQDTREIITLDSSSLPIGIYFIQLVGENRTFTQRLVVMKE